MQISKDQILKGVTSYIRSDVMPNITDGNFKFIMTAAMSAMDVDKSIADAFFNNPLVKAFEHDGMYDMENLEHILTKTLKECGSYVLTIPAVKFVMPHEQELTFNEADVTNLFKHIRSVA